MMAALANGGYALTWVGSNFQVIPPFTTIRVCRWRRPSRLPRFGFETRIAALPDGNYALTWIRRRWQCWTAVYNALGQQVSVPVQFHDTASNPFANSSRKSSRCRTAPMP